MKTNYLWEGDQPWLSRVVNQNDYSYSHAGQRLTNAVSDNTGPVRTEAYDRLYRLTGVNYGDTHTRAYAFDAMGNRTSYTVDGGNPEGSTYNAANMLLTRGGQSYTNDAAGNTTVDGVTGRQMSWNSQNRMTQCVVNNTTSTFTYGADGLRRRMVVGANTTDYLLDGQNVAREIKNGVVDATYLNGPRGPECKRNAAGVYEWYVYDGLGSVVATVNDAGTVVSSRAYDVYGAVRSGGGGTRHKFCGSLGHASDDETGLVYMRARYMDPATGRFVSEDPAGDGGNWYSYAHACPTGVRDPDGQFGVADVSAGMWLGEALGSAGLDALFQLFGTGSVNWGEVGIAFGVGAVTGGVGHYARWLHYARTPAGRRAWSKAEGSFGEYVLKVIGKGTETTLPQNRDRFIPLKMMLTNGAGTRVFSDLYNSYIAGYLD